MVVHAADVGATFGGCIVFLVVALIPMYTFQRIPVTIGLFRIRSITDLTSKMFSSQFHRRRNSIRPGISCCVEAPVVQCDSPDGRCDEKDEYGSAANEGKRW